MARTAFCLQNSMTKRRIHRLRRLPEACPTFGRVTDPKLRARRTATHTHTHTHERARSHRNAKNAEAKLEPIRHHEINIL